MVAGKEGSSGVKDGNRYAQTQEAGGATQTAKNIQKSVKKHGNKNPTKQCELATGLADSLPFVAFGINLNENPS